MTKQTPVQAGKIMAGQKWRVIRITLRMCIWRMGITTIARTLQLSNMVIIIPGSYHNTGKFATVILIYLTDRGPYSLPV